MPKACIEVSVVNRAVDAGHSGAKIAKLLRARGIEPAAGLHMIYELARTFLSEGGVQRGRELFTFVEKCDPSFQPWPRNLVDQEVDKLRRGLAVLPFLDHDNYVAVKQEVVQLAAGHLRLEGESLIRKREEEISVRVPAANREYLEQVKRLRESDARVPRFPTFDHVLAHFQSDYARFIKEIVEQSSASQLSDLEAHDVAGRLDEFPAIRSLLRSHLYLMFHILSHGVLPGDDKLDDYRHVVEASYCDAFVTADGQLARTASRINPSLAVVSYSELLAT